MKKDPAIRKSRVEALILKEVSEIIFSEIKDPRVQGTIVSRVEVSDNMRRATVYIVPQKDVERHIEGLKSAAGFVRAILKKRISMRILPTISFEIDDEYTVLKEEKDEKL
jgi:ribosome-binding factor A